MTISRSNRGRYVSGGMEVRDGSVVRLSGTKMEMIVKSFEGEFARCVWLDIAHEGNEYPFQLQTLERVSW